MKKFSKQNIFPQQMLHVRTNGATFKETIICLNGHILISFVFSQFTSFHSVFHSFRGLMNSINWPASSIWVFIAQLGEHCSANAEATGSNPVEAPKNLFFGLFSQLLKLRFAAMVTYSFHLYSRSSHHFIQCFIPFAG